MLKIEFSGDDLSGVLAQMRVFMTANEPVAVVVPEVAPKSPPKVAAKADPEPAPEVEQLVEDPKPAEPLEITYDHVRDGVLKLAGHYGDRAKVLTFLNKFNVSNANQLDKGRYPEFMAAIEKELG
jgi:hypothetical protein